MACLLDSTLGEVLLPGGGCEAWPRFLPGAWWWCMECCAVFQEKEIGYTVYERTQSDLICPHCDGSLNDYLDGQDVLRRGLYWYHGWLSRVLVGWVPYPVSGQRFYLPNEPSQEITLQGGEGNGTVTKDDSGTDSHHPPLQGNGSGGFQGG